MTHRKLYNEISGLFGKSNECNLEIHKKLLAVKEKELWKLKSWAGGNKFRKYSFRNYIVKELGIPSLIWFNNIGKILELKNGKELYIKYGHNNMVTYLRSTESERDNILYHVQIKEWKSPFSTIKRTLFGPLKMKKGGKKIENIWKVKYNKMRVERDKLKKELFDLQEQLKGLVA